jgi:hypothetical protein
LLPPQLVRLKAVILQSIPHSISYTGHVSDFFLSQSVKLNATNIEAADFIKNVNAEEILDEWSVELYSCEVSKNLFPLRNIP